MNTKPAGTVIAVIAVVMLLLFAGIWTWILVLSLIDAAAGNPASIGNEFVVAAGALSTLLASLTSASIGSAIADVKGQKSDGKGGSPASSVMTVEKVAAELSWRSKAAIVVYILVGLGVLGVWLVMDTLSPEVVTAFALSLVGWLIGAAGIVFESPPTSSPLTKAEAAPTAEATKAKPRKSARRFSI
ncbi:hypothetical protein [Agromyces sp. NPDC058110]|uniref:hypothetical protein n=1 Tax=Agromyces sp. NPDC058110 TaxID=3346345 RepID=UPI0036DF4101